MIALLELAVFPALFGGSLVAFHALLAAGVAPGLALAGSAAANLALVALLEIALPLRKDWSWWSDRQVWNDAVHGVLLSLVGGRIAEIALASGVAALAAEVAREGGAWPTRWPLPAQIALAIVLTDFVEWLKHSAYHRVPWLWPIHALHHDVTRLHVFKGARLHFFEASVRYALLQAPLLVAGAPAGVLIWYAALVNFLGNLNHSNLALRLPRWADLLFATPNVHRLHHEIDPDLGRSNLSSVSLLPDHLFGTFRDPLRHPLRAVGAPGSPIPAGVLGQLASPLLWRWLSRRRAAALAAAAALTLAAAGAAEERPGAANPRGHWATPGFGSIVELRSCPAPNQTLLCGRILWLWQDRDSAGRPRADRENADPKLRARGLVGIEMLRGFRETAPGVWTGGTVYNPDDGRTYGGSIRSRANGTLELEGCALRVFCASQTWHRAEAVLANAAAALASAAP